MDVSGQLNDPAALLPGNEPLLPFAWEAVWVVQPVAQSLYQLSYDGPSYKKLKD